MFREIVSSVPGNHIFAIAVMLFFILVFTGIVIWALKADRAYLDHMKQLPLDKMNNNGEAKDV